MAGLPPLESGYLPLALATTYIEFRERDKIAIILLYAFTGESDNKQRHDRS